MKSLLITVAFLLCSPCLMAQTNDKAEAAFCDYTMEQAKAQRDLLRLPDAVVGPVQPSTGTPAQIVFGVSSSLGDIRKASRTMVVGQNTCSLYTAMTEAQMKLTFALPGLEKNVLKHRLALIQSATDKLDALIAESMKSVESQNLTKPALYSLQNAKVRLDTSRTAALTGLASPYVPAVSDVPLRTLVANELGAENHMVTSENQLVKQNEWDLRMNAGVHRQLSNLIPGSSATLPYAELSFTYNIGSRGVNKHLDTSVRDYNAWKASQFDDVAGQSEVLRRQIVDTMAAQAEELVVLHTHDNEIEADLRALDNVDTSNATAFRNELIADQTVLRVDIEDIQFRLDQLKQYLADNF